MTIKITTEFINELKAKAKLATPGIWTWEDDPPTLYAGRTSGSMKNFLKYGSFGTHGLNLLGRLDLDWNGKNNLDFIAATGPEVIVALLAEIERLPRENAK